MVGETWNSSKGLSFTSYPGSSRTIPKTTDQVLEMITLILTSFFKDAQTVTLKCAPLYKRKLQFHINTPLRVGTCYANFIQLGRYFPVLFGILSFSEVRQRKLHKMGNSAFLAPSFKKINT